jgi:hypothetical protein
MAVQTLREGVRRTIEEKEGERLLYIGGSKTSAVTLSRGLRHWNLNHIGGEVDVDEGKPVEWDFLTTITAGSNRSTYLKRPSRYHNTAAKPFLLIEIHVHSEMRRGMSESSSLNAEHTEVISTGGVRESMKTDIT